MHENEESGLGHQIRRLPVVDEEQRLVGILSLNDLALQAKQAKKKSGLSTAQVGETLADICARAPRAATAG